MSENNNQKIKLIRIMDYLKTESSPDKPLTTKQIIQYLAGINISCERRTLYKDMEMLIENGADIVKTELGRINAYYYDDKSLSLAELKILIDAVQAANFITPAKTEEIYEKILALAGSRKQEIIRDNIIFYNNHKHTNEDIYDNIEQIERAVREKKQITFYYFDLDENAERAYRKDKKRYITDPVALVFSGDNYYLVAYSQKYQGGVNYRVDRMDTVNVEDTSICKEALIRKKKPETYTEQVFRMYNGQVETVTLEFAPELLGAVYDKFGEQLEIRHSDSGWLKIKVTLQISPPFFGWIFQFKDKMHILDPANIREEYRNSIKSAVFYDE